MSWLKNLVGAGIVAAAWVFTAWWTSPPSRSPYHQTFYDMCLVQNAGNTVACDASMRLLTLREAKDQRTKDQARQMMLAGSSKREIVDWVRAQGLVGSGIADAAGISLEDLQAGRY